MLASHTSEFLSYVPIGNLIRKLVDKYAQLGRKQGQMSSTKGMIIFRPAVIETLILVKAIEFHLEVTRVTNWINRLPFAIYISLVVQAF